MSEQTRVGLTATVRQLVRFGVVGGSGVLVNLVVTYVMTQLNGGVSNDNRIVLELPGPYALRYTALVWIGGFLVANLWNFQLNRSWTFKREQTRGWWAEFWPFFIVGALAAAAGILIKVALTNPTSPIYLPDPPFNDHQGLRARAYWAQLITIVATMPINYVVNRVWTFRAIRPEATADEKATAAIDVPAATPAATAPTDGARAGTPSGDGSLIGVLPADDSPIDLCLEADRVARASSPEVGAQ